MLRHRRAQLRQLLRELDELVVLGLLLRSAIRGVVEVLLPTGLVVARRLQLRPRARGDPDLFPGRRDRELLDALELRRVADPATPLVDVPEGTLPSLPSPPHADLHCPPDARRHYDRRPR